MEIISHSLIKTKIIGKTLAQEALKTKKDKALVIKLEGDLGSGKTSFTQGFAQGLKIKEKILSPTFVLMKKFDIINKNFKRFYHIDCYRINNYQEILNLNFKEIVDNSENIVIIEWPEKIKRILPKDCLTVKFNFIDEKKREIFIG